MFKKVSILVLTMAISFEITSDVFAKRQKKRFSAKGRVAKSTSTASSTESSVSTASENTVVVPQVVNNTNDTYTINDLGTIREAVNLVLQNQTFAGTTNVDVVSSVVKDELAKQGNQSPDIEMIKSAVREVLGEYNVSVNSSNTADAEADKKIKEAKDNLLLKIEEVKTECSGIKSDIDTLFGLTTATMAVSGTGTLAAGGALAVGLVKNANENKLKEEEKANKDYDALFNDFKSKVDEISYEDKWFSGLIEVAPSIKKLADEVGVKADKIDDKKLLKRQEDLQKEKDKAKTETGEADEAKQADITVKAGDELKADLDKIVAGLKEVDTVEKYKSAVSTKDNTKVLNNVRTGLMVGATVTSAGATTTSVISAVSAGKLAKKMESCNAKLSELNIIKGQLEAELNDQNITEMPKVMTDASDIIGACEKYEKKSIENVTGLMIGSSIASGIGTATAGVGTFASMKAGKGEDIKVGKKDGGTTFDSDKVANIMAGVTAGTSATSTGLSIGAMTQAKKDSEKAKKCEAKLAE